MMLKPEGRVVLISGANRGIGRAMAERLYADGYTLSLGVRRPETVGDWNVASDGARVLVHPFEARDAASPA